MEPFQLLPLILQASPFVWATMLTLLACSLWTWYVFVWKMIETRVAVRQCNRFQEYYTHSGKRSEIFRQLSPRYATLSDLERLYVGITTEFRSMYQAHPTRIDFVIHHLEKRADQFIGERVDQLSRYCSSLATIATTAPFIGLLGTVWGVIDVFSSLGQAGQINLATIAPGIAETLVATALGLVAAIPAAIAYNWTLRRISQVAASHEQFASTLISEFSRSDVSRPAAPRPATPTATAPRPTT